jgi:hypothetical protein
MNISNFKRKSVATLLIISFIFSGFTAYPKKAEALIPSVDPATAALWVKEYVLDPIVFIATRFLIKGLVVSMTKWVDSGFDGAPLFATDPEGFLLDIGDNVMGDFIQSSGFGALCSPFQAQVKIALITKYNNGKIRSRDPYQASCKLSSVSNNIQQFIKGNFSQGGWPAWLALTQDVQGNPYSALVDAQAQAELRIGGERGQKSIELSWAQGFINFSDCIQKNANGKCTKHGPTKTPGQVIASKLNTNLGSDLKTLEISDELSELLGAILNQVIGTVFTGSKALFSGSGTGTGGGGGGGGARVAAAAATAGFGLFLEPFGRPGRRLTGTSTSSSSSAGGGGGAALAGLAALAGGGGGGGGALTLATIAGRAATGFLAGAGAAGRATAGRVESFTTILGAMGKHLMRASALGKPRCP